MHYMSAFGLVYYCKGFDVTRRLTTDLTSSQRILSMSQCLSVQFYKTWLAYSSTYTS